MPTKTTLPVGSALTIGRRTYTVVTSRPSGPNTVAATKGKTVGDLLLEGRRGRFAIASLRSDGSVRLG